MTQQQQQWLGYFNEKLDCKQLYPLLNFLNGGRTVTCLSMMHCLPILTLAKSPRIITPSRTIDFPLITIFWEPQRTVLLLTLFPDACLKNRIKEIKNSVIPYINLNWNIFSKSLKYVSDSMYRFYEILLVIKYILEFHIRFVQFSSSTCFKKIIFKSTKKTTVYLNFKKHTK